VPQLVQRAFEYRFHPTDVQGAKMAEPLDIRWSRALPGGVEPTTVTVSRDSAGRWFVSTLCEDSVASAPATDAAVGLDAGITSLVTLSTGEKIANPEYKCAWYGRELVVIDRWFPSSELCGACGTVRERLPPHVREWTCGCGAVHDRDVNAACNILAAGLAASACGDGVRPQRESSRTGRSSVKQETQRATAGIPRL